MQPGEFLEDMYRIGVGKTRDKHMFAYREREIYVLQDPSAFPTDEPLTTSYSHWRNHPSFKTSSESWIDLAGVPLVEMAIVLRDYDKLEGEFREDLGYPWDSTSLAPPAKNPWNKTPDIFRRKYSCHLSLLEGKIIRAKLGSMGNIRALFAKFDEGLKKRTG